LNDVCAVLPDRQDDGVPNVFVDTALPASMTDRPTVLSTVKECLETTQGDLLSLYGISPAQLAAVFDDVRVDRAPRLLDSLLQEI